MVEPITVVIPTLPERARLLERALASLRAQTLQPAAVLVEPDPERTGMAATRNRALRRVGTPLVAFLDDDDELYPEHLETLSSALKDADLVWSDCEVIGADHRPSWIGVAHLARTEAVRAVGGFPEPHSGVWPYMYEDWGLLALLIRNGAAFRKVNQVTWRYHIHPGNTVGTAFVPEQPGGDCPKW